jgi:hypothetical protein
MPSEPPTPANRAGASLATVDAVSAGHAALMPDRLRSDSKESL